MNKTMITLLALVNLVGFVVAYRVGVFNCAPRATEPQCMAIKNHATRDRTGFGGLSADDQNYWVTYCSAYATR